MRCGGEVGCCWCGGGVWCDVVYSLLLYKHQHQ